MEKFFTGKIINYMCNMTLTKRQLNKRLSEEVLKGRDFPGQTLQGLEIRVMRARPLGAHQSWRHGGTNVTGVHIRIKGKVLSSKKEMLPLTRYGSKAIRNYLRISEDSVNKVIGSWVKLWGFTSNIYVENMTIVYESDKI